MRSRQPPASSHQQEQEQTKRFGPAILAVDQDGTVTMRVMADAYAGDADVAAEVARLPPGRGRSGFYLIRFRVDSETGRELPQ